jgi:ubiquitin carboxyl-terminal hydrolase L5
LQDALEGEQRKRRLWADENIRRRHNYIPLMFHVLRALADTQQLDTFITAARTPKPSKGSKGVTAAGGS